MIFNKKDDVCYRPFREYPNFRPIEFKCPCNICNHIFLDLRLPELLQKVRTYCGKPVFINHGGGHRCPRYNDELIKRGLPASPKSKHIMGQAVDISIEGLDGASIGIYLYMAGFRRIGIASNWAHGDVATGEAFWHYAPLEKEHLDNFKKRVNMIFRGQ